MTSYTIYKQNYFTQKKGKELITPNECNILTYLYRFKGHQVTRSQAKVAKQLSQGTKTRMRDKLGMFGEK